jgi:two-component system chemotaxis sensor kinase CheA
MADKESEFLERLKATFRVEAQEHLSLMYSGLHALEQTADGEQLSEGIETVFREAHSLKGAAASVGFPEIQRTCQQVESIFSALKRKEMPLTPQILDQLHASLDSMQTALGAEQQAEAPAMPSESVSSMLDKATHREVWAPSRPLPATVRIATEKLDSLFLKAEEMLAAKLLAQHRKEELMALRERVDAWSKTWSSLATRHSALLKAAEQAPEWRRALDDNAAFMKGLLQDLVRLDKAADQDLRTLGRMTADLLDDMKSALLLPFSVLLESFPKLVRDLARAQGKDVDFIMRGGELEVDRRVLEEIKDAVVHLLRNSVDHGLEPPSLRAAGGKPKRGTIQLILSPAGGEQLEICIEDDGGGIDIARIKSTAARLGLMDETALAQLTEAQALDLLFVSGMTTSAIVTSVSGRGLGLAIVREKVQKLGGTIQVESHPGAGTRFRLRLPNTLANYRGILVSVGAHWFVFPTRHVQRSLRVERSRVETFEGQEALRIDGEAVAVVALAGVLGLEVQTQDDAYIKVVVLADGDRKMAIAVDEILHEQEVLVKGLGKQLVRVPNIEAATILGSGRVVPILNVADLMKSAARAAASTTRPRLAPAPPRVQPASQKHVLVVEDSITARSLLKGLLEMAGYRVTTAVDGEEAWSRLADGRFDIVVTDIEMPRMDGIALTERMRGDGRFEAMPVVLVTGLDSPQDRQRGMAAGASAYLVKRSFEQSDLLGAVARLVGGV